MSLITPSPSPTQPAPPPTPVVAGGALPENAICADFIAATPEAQTRYTGFTLLAARDYTMPSEQEINAFFGHLALECVSDDNQSTPLEQVAEQVLQEVPTLLS